MKNILEICCYSLESALAAEKAGADRIELCDNFYEGGTTPSFATIALAIEKLKIPIHVLIRPRGGDFLYSDLEFECIKEDVIKVKQLGAQGIVLGFLKANGEIDWDKTEKILDLADGMDFTFHRAFDMCRNPKQALTQLKNIGVKRILSSGTKQTAYEGRYELANWIQTAGDELVIMPGSGVNSCNLQELITSTQAHEFHSSAKTFIPSPMNYFNTAISMGKAGDPAAEYQKVFVDTKEIEQMKNILNN